MFNLSLTAGLIMLTCLLGVVDPEMVSQREEVIQIRLPMEYGPNFAINGFVVLTDQGYNRGWFDHEYGHYLQQKERGFKRYAVEIVIPSMIGSLYDGIRYGVSTTPWPWEAEADDLSKEFSTYE